MSRVESDNPLSSAADTSPSSAAALESEDLAGVRSKSVVILGDAMGDPAALYDTGCAVESALFKATSGNEYRARVRSLAFNLRNNESLRCRLLSGELSPSALINLTSDELATHSMASERAKMEERLTRKRTRSGFDDATRTTSYKCGGCGGRSCEYIFVSGNRDIGKNETWGSKDSQSDGATVLVRCTACLHEWRERML